MDKMNYTRLLDLKDSIDNNQASAEEKKEYMNLMHKNGNITDKQYQDYLANKNSDAIIKGALTIGGVLLAGWLISKLLDS